MSGAAIQISDLVARSGCAQWGAHMHKQPLHTQRRTAVYLTRVYQKIAFSRGRGRTLCTKSHLVGLLPQLKAMHPTARFVTIVRPIQGIFPSFWSLQCAISRDFGRIDSARPEYLAMRIAFFKEIHARLVALFGSGDAADARVLTFNNFIADPVGEVVDLYASWGIPASRCALMHRAFSTHLTCCRMCHARAGVEARIRPYLGAEEHAHGMGNATWAAMGVSEADIAELVQCPMLTYAHLNKAAPQAVSPGAGKTARAKQGPSGGPGRLRSASPPARRGTQRRTSRGATANSP